LTKDDVLKLPAAVHSFNGFYTVRGQFTMENSMRILIAFAVLVLVAAVTLLWLLVRYIRRRRRARKAAAQIQS
jgi:uncharacterized protein HemY